MTLYRNKRVDGFILSGVMSADKSSLIQILQQNSIPFVMIGRSLQHNIFCIHTIISGTDMSQPSICWTRGTADRVPDRESGCRCRARPDRRVQAGASQQWPGGGDDDVVLCGSEEADMIAALDDYSSGGRYFDAIIAADSVLALGVLKYCRIAICTCQRMSASSASTMRPFSARSRRRSAARPSRGASRTGGAGDAHRTDGRPGAH